MTKTRKSRTPERTREYIVQEIIDLRLKKGYATTSIVKYLEDKYNYNSRSAYSLWKLARERMGELYQEMNDNALIDSILLMENMVQKALEEENGKLALEVLKEMNKCNQLYIKKVELDTKKVPIRINFK